ncbi:hypothetical protein BT96DRAFT_1002327 [Gymnopus androsaceus JB14]|uniref:Uncharacterized protein n=1 Tax=Gymnopus androsaceus JB14 TaxID=1447944 RepID=A0A6A4GZ52_9AGAR|nr:hypothetical protein BT96DRAFT_1002327 [Gymnopus androsaceus JB14]
MPVSHIYSSPEERGIKPVCGYRWSLDYNSDGREQVGNRFLDKQVLIMYAFDSCILLGFQSPTNATSYTSLLPTVTTHLLDNPPQYALYQDLPRRWLRAKYRGWFTGRRLAERKSVRQSHFPAHPLSPTRDSSAHMHRPKKNKTAKSCFKRSRLQDLESNSVSEQCSDVADDNKAQRPNALR